MIRNNHLIGPSQIRYSRTYDHDDWKNNCIAYLDEARDTARKNSPAKVTIYVREPYNRRARRLAATIVCNVRRYENL